MEINHTKVVFSKSKSWQIFCEEYNETYEHEGVYEIHVDLPSNLHIKADEVDH